MHSNITALCNIHNTMYIYTQKENIYSRTSIYRFSRGRRKQTMNMGKRLIQETITHCEKITHK